MKGWPSLTLSRRSGLMVVAVAAVLLPLVILALVQYRSLVDLEGKTKVAVEENLRRSLAGLSRRVAGRLEALAADTLGRIEVADVDEERLERLELKLLEMRREHPQIEAAFVVAHCACREKNFALFATPAGLRRIDHEQLKSDMQTQTAIDVYHNAGLLQADAPPSVLFEQSACALLAGGKDDHLSGAHGDHSQLMVFSPLRRADGEGQAGFAGMVLNSEYLKKTLLPQSVGELLQEGEGAGLAVGILDEQGREIYARGSRPDDYEVTAPFAPVFRRWKLGVGYEGTTIEALAETQFRQNLLLAALSLSLLSGGVALTLRAVARERRLIEAKATFVSNVSHELKTPLALIRLFAETLEMGRVKNAEEMEQYGRIINRESSRLTQLINNILDFSRIEAGRREYRFAGTDLAALLEEVLESYDRQLKSAGFALETRVEAGLPLALVDREAVAQAVLNLLDNAVRYSAAVKRIEVCVERRGEQIAIEIADCGVGIPRSEQGRIFDKFYRVSTGLVHETKGSGLGLAIVKHIVEAHEGAVLVESAPGKGSRFTLLLPLAGAQQAAAPSNPATATKHGAGGAAEAGLPAAQTRG